jgi:expansin
MKTIRYLWIPITFLIISGCGDTETSLREPVIPPQMADTTTHSGRATYYEWADGSGACMFDPIPGDLMVGAMNLIDYDTAAVCGECVQVYGPSSAGIVIRVTDLCPECPKGNIDLSPHAFSLLADTVLGNIPITWKQVPCPYNTPIVYHFKDGSNQWWTAVQVRNHRYPVAKFEYMTAAKTFKQVERTAYNYFVEPAGMGPGPYTFRVTDVFEQVLIDSAVAAVTDSSIAGHAQFPPIGTVESGSVPGGK